MQKPLIPFAVALLTALATPIRVDAHAFLARAEPQVGSSVKKLPNEVRIWFTEPVQSVSSSIKVFDGTGKQVDKKNTHVDRANHALLHVSLVPGLAPGSYKVIWRATSVDSHATNGDFRFQIVP